MSSKVVDSVKSWTVRLSVDQEALLDHGKYVELLCPTGLVIIRRSDDGATYISWLAESEASFATRRPT